MLQRIASTALTTAGVIVASASVIPESPWGLVGVVGSVLGGIWLMTRSIIQSQQKRIEMLWTWNVEQQASINRITAKDGECQKSLAVALERISNLEKPK